MNIAPRSASRRRPSTTRSRLTTREREIGMLHLSHMERLARIRLGPSKGIQGGTPGVELAEDHAKEASGGSQPFGTPSIRYMRLVKAKEKDLYRKNQVILNHLIESTRDSVRHTQQICGSPDEEDEMGRRKNEQAQRRWLQRRRLAESVQEANQTLLRHLIDAKPNVKTAESLNDWYTHVHRNRVAKISRFKPAEPFAGARILEQECGVRLGQGWTTSSGSEGGDHARSTRVPLLRGHPFPPPDVGEVLRTVPRALLPPLISTSYDGFVVHTGARGPFAEETGGERGERGPSGRAASSRRVRRPPWQNISASDLPILRHMREAALAGSGRVPPARVQAHEEGGCTQIWRRAVGRKNRADPRGRPPGHPGTSEDVQGVPSNAAPSPKTSHLTIWSADASAPISRRYLVDQDGSSTPMPPDHKADTQHDTERGEWLPNGNEVVSTEQKRVEGEDSSSDIPYHSLLKEWLDASRCGVGKAYIAL